MKLTGDTFRDHIIAQDDDRDYSESGYVVAAFSDNKAVLARYSHCSCYGTWTSINGGGVGDFIEGTCVKDATFDWEGTHDELVAMARRKADPSMPERESGPEDYDHDHLMAVYEQVIQWNAAGRKIGKVG